MSNIELATALLTTPFGLLAGALLGTGVVSSVYIWWADR